MDSTTHHTLTNKEQKGYFTFPNGSRFFGWYWITGDGRIISRPIGIRIRMEVGPWQDGMVFIADKKANKKGK